MRPSTSMGSPFGSVLFSLFLPQPCASYACEDVSSTSSRPTAPALSSGSLPLPHLGDCTHDGQPSAHSQAAMASRVARSQSAAAAEAALGEAGAARVAVVDEDGRAPRCRGAGRWRPRRCPSGRRWRRAAAGRSRRARRRGPRPAGRPVASPACGEPCGRRPSTTPRGCAGCRGGRSSGSSPSTSPVAQARAQERDDLVGHLDGAEVQPWPGPTPAARDSPSDPDVGDLAGRWSCSRGRAGSTTATPSSRSSSVDQVGLALVQVDRAGVHGARAPSPGRRCRAAGRCRSRRPAPGARRCRGCRRGRWPAAVGSRTSRAAGGAAARLRASASTHARAPGPNVGRSSSVSGSSAAAAHRCGAST